MRWEIVNSLLAEYGIEELRVVEVGVFAGHFSKFLLERFPKLQLIGIDPYIGREQDTFSGSIALLASHGLGSQSVSHVSVV